MNGYRVAYADEAHADAEMVSGEKESRRQRQRWEQGRFALMRAKTLPLLACTLRTGARVPFDLALDLLVLPLSYVALNIVLLMGLAIVAAVAGLPGSTIWLWTAVGCLGAMCAHILRGWQLSDAGLQGLLDLARAPFFMIWKVLVMLTGPDSKEWVRTKRENS
jgi:1,2-diacylglycerol 3-beta-glucosyltransferase